MDLIVPHFLKAIFLTPLTPLLTKLQLLIFSSYIFCFIKPPARESRRLFFIKIKTIFYQSGYLTIKKYDEFGYTLGFPNEEVKQALYDQVLPSLALRSESDLQSLQANLYAQLGTGETDEAMKTLKALIADVPYSNKKLASMDMEERYRLIISTILNAIGLKVEVEKMISTGRIDMTVQTSRYIYVIELKLRNNGGKSAATHQIFDRQYLEPFLADSRQVIGLGLELDDKGKGLIDWQEVQQ